MTNVSGDFLQQLQQALKLRGQWLEETRLPLLKEALRTFRALFESITSTLVQKGLLREDRYEYDGRPTELTVPLDAPIPETSEADEAGSRISAYRLQLDFLVDSVPLTLETLDLATLRKIIPLLCFIDWTGFGETSASATTRALSRAITKVRLGADATSARVLHESQVRIERLLREIRVRVAEIEAWQRESWKAEVREKAMPRAVLQLLVGKAERGEILAVLRRSFDQALPDAEWRPELVQEILAEERTEDGAVKRERLLRSLELPAPGPSKEAVAEERRCSLLEGVHSLCRVREEIEFAESVLVHNEHEQEKRSLGVMRRLRRWLHKIVGRLDDRLYDVEVRDSPTAEPRIETVNFLHFIAELREMQEVLAELSVENGPERVRVLGMTDGQVCEFIDWQISQIRRLHRRMEALNEYFQLQAVRLHSGSVRSIRVELLAMENGMLRADKVRRECVDKLEDSERLKAIKAEE
jgi:hypothetical protein